MLRYQQQYDFFDVTKVKNAIHFANLSEQVLTGRLDEVSDQGLVVGDPVRKHEVITGVPQVRLGNEEP